MQESRISSFWPTNEFRMTSLLDNATVLHDTNAIDPSNGRQTMSHKHGGSTSH
ncbi:hypothetical protein A2U01_0042486 [Trifolium medium]|uniref:Uncharacterized protein n=1 Tax=Trifolium medium TaxID=97028 RepID=A0A392QC59_9FABA|nr:hypothetical protein [Trifolium medium]